MRQKTVRFILNVALLVVVSTPLIRTQAAIAAPDPTLSLPTFPLPTSVPDQTTVRIDGDGSMALINQRLKDRYQQEFPGTQVELDAQGTDAALQALLKDEIDLAAIGRPLTEAEKANGLVEMPLSQERIAVLVGSNNPFKGNLTVEQFVQMLRGDITDWSDVGGSPGVIRVIDRPLTSDTRLALSRYGIFQPEGLTIGANAVQLEDDDTATVIRQLSTDGIGYAIASQVINQNKARVVKLVVMHEALPDDPLYPYAQPRGYAYKKAPALAASSFLGLATAAAGQSAIADAKTAEATAVVDAFKPAPMISVVQTDEPDTSPFAQTSKALPWWLRLVLPLGLLGLIFQWALKRFEPKPLQPSATRSSDSIAARPPSPPENRPMTATLVTPTGSQMLTEPTQTAGSGTHANTESILEAQIVAQTPDVTLSPVEAPTVEESEEESDPNPITAIAAGTAAIIGQVLPTERRDNYWTDAQQVYAHGVELVAAGQYGTALGCFDRAIELNPSFADAWIAKGKALINLGRRKEARSNFVRAAELRPRDETVTQYLTELEAEPGVIEAAVPIPSIAKPTVTEAILTEATIPESIAADATIPTSGESISSETTSPETTADEATALELIVAEPAMPDAIAAESISDAIIAELTTLEATINEPIVEPKSPEAPTDAIVPDSSPTATPPQPIASEARSPISAIASVIPLGDVREGFSVETFKQAFRDNLLRFQGKALEEATPQDCYTVLAYMVRDRLMQFETPEAFLTRLDNRWIGEVSAEYTPGAHLQNNLVNLGSIDLVRQGIQDLGLNLDAVCDQEAEPGLGKGGLGRLMVCYLESMSTQAMPAIGYGIRYEKGFFDQEIHDGWQVETPDTWLQGGNPWEIKRPDGIAEVKFGGRTEASLDEEGRYRVRWIPQEVVKGIPYDTPILGYQVKTVNLLRLWRAESDSPLGKVLYPVDVEFQGQELRLKQQFFLVSCALQDAIRLHLGAGRAIETLHERVALQLNDTDTTLAIPELMRLLVDEHGLEWSQAWETTRNTLSYTNHSLMPETLDDRWSIAILASILPRHLEIIFEINARFLEAIHLQAGDDLDHRRRLSLIDEMGDRHVRLTNLACVGTHAINGVSALHTELLEQTLLSDFYALYPDRFSNKTNGISPRRFLRLSNPRLADLITRRLGDRWITNLDELHQLADAADDGNFRHEWQQVKQAAKRDLAAIVHQQTGIDVDVNSLFDIQTMVLHEYKRQHLNVLHILTLYNRIKANPDVDLVPRTFIFSGKAAPDYFTAKLIIKLIHAVADLVNADPDVRGRLKVVFLPAFTLKAAQQILPAADLAEHLSTAGMEASDTGNMMAALNGGLIIGTPDGSNLELFQEVGADNVFQFGLTATEAAVLRATGYNPWEVYNANSDLKGAIDVLTNGTLSDGDTELFQPLVHLLLSSDYYLLLADYQSYIDCQMQVSHLYRDQDAWTRKSILATARMGKFSSDRSIREYCQSIWNVEPVQVEIADYVPSRTALL